MARANLTVGGLRRLSLLCGGWHVLRITASPGVIRDTLLLVHREAVRLEVEEADPKWMQETFCGHSRGKH
jgi:hypothetical protein